MITRTELKRLNDSSLKVTQYSDEHLKYICEFITRHQQKEGKCSYIQCERSAFYSGLCISLMAYDMDWGDEANEGPGKRGTQMVRTQLEEL